MGKTHQIQKKTAQPKSKQMNWLFGRRSTPSMESKLLLYKAVLKPILTYGIQLQEAASNSNIKILKRFQSKPLQSILDAPWHINNHRVHEDLQMNTVLNGIKTWTSKFHFSFLLSFIDPFWYITTGYGNCQ
jgi:hypothetical protein